MESGYEVLAGVLHVREGVGITAVIAVLEATQGSQLSAADAVEGVTTRKRNSPSPSPSPSSFLHLRLLEGDWLTLWLLHTDRPA